MNENEIHVTPDAEPEQPITEPSEEAPAKAPSPTVEALFSNFVPSPEKAPEPDTDSLDLTPFFESSDSVSPEKGETPVFTETVRKPGKVRKKLSERPFFVAGLTAAFMCVLFALGVYLMREPIRREFFDSSDSGSLLTIAAPRNDAPSDTAVPNVSKAVSGGTALTNQQIAAQVSPSIVGVSNMSYSANSYLNINTLQSSGSGIIVSEDGYIVTNNHVVSNANKLKITLFSGDELDATLVGTDATTDIAILKVDPSGIDLKAAVLGHSSDLQVGDTVLAIGNPLGLTLAGSVTHGIVSALNRKLTVEGTTYNLIQTDAAINSGNSGGALVNNYGEVVGINSAKISYSGIEGLGFAIPIDDIKDIIEDLIRDGYVHGRPSFGVTIVEINPQLAYYYSLPVNYGLFVNSVIPGGSADNAGIEVGDIIIAFEDEKVTSQSEFIAKRNLFVAGDTVKITVNRDGTQMDFSVKLQEEKPSSVQ